MPSTHSRRTVLSLCGLGVFAGCLGGSPTDENASDTATTGTSDRTATTEATTIPQSAVSDAEAKERALAAEEAYLTEQLQDASCLENWGTYPTTSSERATVTDRTADGVRVEVSHPYSYSTARTEADGASRAVYLVTADDARRVRGDLVTPC